MIVNQPAQEPMLYIITGSRGAGKTTFCQAVVNKAREAGLKTAGLLSLPVFEGQYRTAIEAQDMKTGEKRTLATRSEPGEAEGMHTKHWKFDPEVLTWGNRVLENSTPCDFLLVDELGTLEFEYDRGWQSAFEAVDSRQYAVAMVVIRSELLGEALVRWPHAYIVEIETPDDSREKARILSQQLF